MNPIFNDDNAGIPLAPPRLIRQTNDRYMFEGQYPELCAAKEQIEIGKTQSKITRHVLQVEVPGSICDTIRLIQDQLMIFVDAGLMFCCFQPGRVILDYLGEKVIIEFVYDGKLHVLISKKSRLELNGFVYPTMEDLNKLIYVLRTIVMDHTLPPYQNIDFDIDEDLWHSLQSMTLEPTHEYYGIFEPRLFLPFPDDLHIANDFLHPDASFWDSVFAQVDNPLHFK